MGKMDKAGEEAKDTVFKEDEKKGVLPTNKTGSTKDVKPTVAGKAKSTDNPADEPSLSAAKQIIALGKENMELKMKLALQEQHIDRIDPDVLVAYKGIRKDFVFRGFDFSTGTCTMLKSEAKALITHDPMCFALA